MKRIVTIAIGILTSLALAIPADAATVKVTDVRGDANALNDQGFGGCLITGFPFGIPDLCLPNVPNNNPTDPASYAAMDILSATVGSQKVGRRPVAMIVTMTLAAPPTNGAVYRVTGDMTPDGDDCTTFLISYYRDPDGNKDASVRTCDSKAALGYSDATIPTPTVKGSKITWKIPYSALAKRPSPIRPGMVLKNIGGHVRANLSVNLPPNATGRTGAGATVPEADRVDSTKSYKLGS